MKREELKQQKKELKNQRLAKVSLIISIPVSITSMITNIIAIIKFFKGGG